MAIRTAGLDAWRTALHADGNLDQSSAKGCQVIHIHGYWYGSDTLHTGNQLKQDRPNLRKSLSNLMRDKTVVVIGYGGWQDILMETLASLVDDPTTFPEIIWAFFDRDPVPSEYILKVLAPGLNRNRVTFYAGIDCHDFFPRLAAEWQLLEAKKEPARVSTATSSWRPRTSLRSLECDRPPSVDTWVGRVSELQQLVQSEAKVVAISGIGGEGKSSLAAKYLLELKQSAQESAFWDWRDCREEGDRIRTQLLSVVERISDGRVSGSALASSTDDDLADIFVELCEQRLGVYVFDNVDHHVDLENIVVTGLLGKIVDRFIGSPNPGRLIITCRPQVRFQSSAGMSIHLKGISREEALDLFSFRCGTGVAQPDEVDAVHELTKGHVFWLDLLAAQVSRGQNVTLSSLIEDIRRGRSEAPNILGPIWERLHERERLVLRAMAEMVRPETEQMIESIVSSELHYGKFRKALTALTSLNLIVVKPEANAPDLYDLHPLVRQFLRKNFARVERIGFITPLLRQYKQIVTKISAIIGVDLPFAILERWPQKAELELEAGLTEEAFQTLNNVRHALVGGGYVEEFIRVGKKLFEAVDWETASVSIKSFDLVLDNLIDCLNHIGDYVTADDLMRRYEGTVSSRTARYIRFCNVKGYAYWIRGEYPEAIEWARRGEDLKQQTNVDTGVDCAHTLALALRDSGDPAAALEMFRGNHNVEDLVSGEASSAAAQTVGNVGRCLQKLGRFEEALKCYRISAAKLEADDSGGRLDNQAYAREWIAECLEALGQPELAYAFFTDAERILTKVSPKRRRAVQSSIERLRLEISQDGIEVPLQASRRVQAWIAGRLALLNSNLVDGAVARS